MDQDGVVQQDKHVAEITHLLTRAACWPAGLRWVVRRTKPSRRQARNLTAFEKATGWRYSIIVTNIPAARGIPGVPGSHHAQFIDVLHRQHAVVEDGVRTAKSMGLRNLPSKTWVVNCGWMLAANLATDLAAWCRLLGLYDCDDLKDAEPDTLRYRLWSLPARLVRHARQRILNVFGNAFNVGEHYVEYATPGLIVLAICYGLAGTAVSVSTDMTKGIINRFKVMNVSRGAVLTGHVVATMLISSIAIAVIIGMAFALGFRSPATPSTGSARSVSPWRRLSRPPGSRSRWEWRRKLRNPQA